jgi:pimeloyl-ACP methyl ester carboxylesterase
MACLLGVLACFGEAVDRTEGPFTCPLGRQYWLGFPHGYDPGKTYWLVAAIHGAGGDGDGMKTWQMSGSRTDYLVVAPSFPGNAKEGFYQGLGGQSDTQLIGLFQQLKTKYHLHDQLFLDGFSGGSQFAHRFAMAHPQLVVGCSAHSGGTWGPEIAKAAVGVPMFFSCGLDDIDPSIAGALPRILEAERYFNGLVEKGMFVKVRYWQGFAHRPCPDAKPLIADLFELATTGLFPHQRVVVDAELARIDGLITAGDFAGAKRALAALPKIKLPANVAKQPSWAALSAEQQAEQRTAFVKAGIGGLSALKRDFWIDERNENQDGWNENLAARAAMQQRYRAWIVEPCATREALIKAGKAPPVGDQRTTSMP